MLNISDLTVTVDDKTLLSVDQLSLIEGEMFGVLGKNGAGKSTFFKAISNDMPSRGRRLFHQQDMSQWPKQALAKHLAVLPQSSQLNFPFSAEEVVSLGLIPLSISQRGGRALVKKMMGATDTAAFAGRLYTSLSGGERQRIHLARVLVQLSQAEQAPLLLLDEPTSAQDLAQQHHILQLAQQFCRQQKYTALVILHDINLSLRYCDRVAMLEQGKLTQCGPPKQILNCEEIEKQWGYQAQQLTSDSGQIVFI
ncbi:Hemin import ATP-binding protein HmuV [Sinobacterium norvegicum]|uniref:Hemin import ATP-binding protein HmuV n=1 Tax=Sinobacterium norvegicum TaxID=1641715 RepID=A0ABN8EHM0_9GAMM|nr:heme ABC transporter ATP-binding protein [Sinobacterium norvegicum]CAH0990609.1 Hemin import ATP-binding protein HmuV [Sinobacterium norvegicum]